jgi:hypothetical protein
MSRMSPVSLTAVQMILNGGKVGITVRLSNTNQTQLEKI